MMNDFYTSSSAVHEAQSFSCMLHYNADHEIFRGHFPGNPIVPGVCTLAIVKEILEAALRQKLILNESKAVKFLGLISPDMSPTLTLLWKNEQGRIDATAALKYNGSALFKMTGSYIPVS